MAAECGGRVRTQGYPGRGGSMVLHTDRKTANGNRAASGPFHACMRRLVARPPDRAGSIDHLSSISKLN